jgi:tripartite-type tricarboxylate transporter receptor subunit TctC
MLEIRMRQLFSRYGLTALLALAALEAPQALAADDFPSKPIHFIVPYPPGGGNDDVARLLARKLEASLGQPVIVENKAGASGMIAGDFVARAAPDGYTVMIDHSGIVMNPALYPKITYDVQRDLAPITLAVAQSNILLATPALPARNVAELLALAKAQPGKLNYASPGNGSPQHIGMEMFTRMAGVDIVHIPYKGGAPATVALIAGEVQLLLSGTTGLPHIKSGKARALATTGATRASALPDVPTVIEAGLPGYTNTNWLGLFAPAKTPAPVIARLNREFVQALRAPDVQKLLAERNYDVVASTPQEFSQVIEQGLREYGKLIRDAGIKPD